VDDCLIGLDLAPLLRALRANLRDNYQPPAALSRLEAIAERGAQPLYEEIGELRRAIGSTGIDGAQIVAARTAITQEIHRLLERQGELAALGRDLADLRDAGAPKWAAACLAAPTEVARLLPEDWRTSWAWAVMRGRLDSIITLGNGDALRERKMDLRKRRERIFEQLIRERTLLGLKRRLTGPVQTALSTFTSAIRRLGKGTGKNAVRWRKAIRKAALEAAPAAPVWVMPEHKVAEQLPAQLADFDLVILDEASQSDVTAISALARGKKHLIVGDEQQVSPSAVGIPQNKMDVLRAEYLTHLPNRDVIDENTSIFDIAMQMFPTTHLMLREHFRCVEPIIQFSTRFYNGRLIPIRVPKASERFDPPLVDVFVKDGQRHGKTNPAEARVIVNEIAAIARDPQHAHRDVAVISLIGGEQADLIERMLIEDPRVGTEVMERLRIVCGDSRTMQGQERSIVFLSMVATPETARSQSSQGIAQRFNVALSRARDRLYLVRSVSTQDLRPGDLKLAVLEHFQDPMPEGRALVGKGVLERCESGFEREVCQRLLNANYRVRSQVKAGPFSIDLMVEGADDRRLAIELDGDAWHGPEKWHEDMARQAALERAGWTFWRVFGSQWLADKGHWWQNLV
ncbi:MAG: AAA domain-containing protein, partial [Thiohalocapsa sp.]